jgi:hypothetical protein
MLMLNFFIYCPAVLEPEGLLTHQGTKFTFQLTPAARGYGAAEVTSHLEHRS